MTTPASLTLLSEGFIKHLVPCCSHGGLHVLTKNPASTPEVFADTEISSSPPAPPPKALGPQHESPSCWEIFITQGWDRGLKLDVYYQRSKNVTTVHRACSSEHAVSQPGGRVSQAERSEQQNPFSSHAAAVVQPGESALGLLWHRAVAQLGTLGPPSQLPSLLKP